MDNFNRIKNNKEIIELYNKISDYEDLTKGWAHHNFEHVNNVAEMTGEILKKLGYNDKFIEEAKIAAILHDTGCLEGKDNHTIRSYEYAKRYLERNNVKLENEDLVLEAIKNHSSGFDTENTIALALILSDKLDIKHTRVAKEGYNIEGMRQLQYIKDILININDNYIEINFLCDELINKLELEEFYFTEKIFNAINAFSKKINLKPIVLFNNENWTKFDNYKKVKK